MFLPVFVHPGKRGPSPVKKSPEKSTAKGGPPTPPPAPTTSITVSLRPGQSNACLSLHSLSLHVKKISTSSRHGSSNRSPAGWLRSRARGGLFFTRVRGRAGRRGRKGPWPGDGARERPRCTPAHVTGDGVRQPAMLVDVDAWTRTRGRRQRRRARRT